MEIKKIHRYPGVKPFTEGEQHIFFGRKTDTDKLFKLINLEKLVLLYSKSGLGKSSLLNAGVIPKLKEETDFIPLSIRLGANSQNSICPVKTALAKLPDAKENKILKKLNIKEETLWTRMKALQAVADKESKSYILFFDQFEELFTYSKEEIKQFKEQLSDMLYAKVPSDIRRELSQKLKEDDKFLSDSELEYIYRQPEIKVVLSIRSDRMSQLNQLTDYLTDILKNYYELGSLDKKSAIEAITKPANRSSKLFLSEPFYFTDKVIDKILNYLTDNENKSIETFQLQTVCQYAENLAIEKQLMFDAKTKSLMVNPNDLGDLKNVFRSHYDNLISKLNNPQKERAARILIENKLIIDNNRVSLPDVVVLKEEGIDKELIYYLHDVHHLIRSEPNTTGTISYELSHDTLVAPILQAKKEREEREEEERARKEQEEKLRKEKEKAEKERIEREKERKQQRRIIIIVSLAAVVAVAFGIFGFVQQRKAKSNLDSFITAEVEKKKIIAINMMDLNQHEVAIKYLEEALKMDPDAEQVDSLLLVCCLFINMVDKFLV